MKREKAITLISLVITIVVLIILASVAIYLSLGNNGIFVRSKQAREATNKQEATDIINLKITTAQMNKYAEKQEMPTLKELSLVLKEDNEIQYVTEERQKVASAEYNVPSENPSSIFTKLNKYPYEFEINSALQLASIDGKNILANNQTANTTTTSDELLIDGEHIVVPCTTTWVNRNIDFTIKSISDYNYLLFTYGNYFDSENRLRSASTTLIPVKDINYGTNQYIILDGSEGTLFTSGIIYIIDAHTIRVYQTCAANERRTHFGITSIKGIK